MDIVFGLFADAGAYPEHGGGATGAIGSPVTGPAGLVDLIDTFCGLGGPSTSNVVRIAGFQAALETMSGAHFWSHSLALDGWATARTLLAWRDQLIEAGWSAAGPWSSPRLNDLAAADRAAAAVAPGLADRLASLVLTLRTRQVLPVRRLRLIDPRAFLPVGWRRLIDALEANGVAVEQIVAQPAADPTTALGLLQRWLVAGGAIPELRDGSVTLASAESGALAADVVGHWFAERGAGDFVLIAQGGDTHLLDLALAGAAQPRGGRSRASAHRGALQVLSLAFKVCWAPFDPHALMALLVFPASPIAARASRPLAAALEQAPGRGGAPWTDAWAAIDAHERAQASGDPAALRKVEARLARWRSWADPALSDPVAGIAIDDALAVCDRVIAWAVARHGVDQDVLYQATASLADAVRAGLSALARSAIPRALVERIIDQALDVGHDNPLAEAEAADWHCVVQPGAIWAAVPAVLWWNFATTSEGIRRQPWTVAERRELADAACPVDDDDLTALLASACWERAILHARDNVVLVEFGLDAGDDANAHPLAHRLAPALDRLATRQRLEDILEAPNASLAGVALDRSVIDTHPLPTPAAYWSTPAGYAARVADLPMSATAFENLFSCQLKWALQHVAGLRLGRARSIPDANRLLGNLAHALVRAIFLPGTPPDPDAAEARAEDLLDGLIDQLAAPLRLPELATQLEHARERLPGAMAHLATVLDDNNLSVEASEQQVSAQFEAALAVRGAVDLLARDSAGAAVIIDLKWTGNQRWRLDELRAGNAVQLATYGALVAGDANYRAGYYLLNQRQLITLVEGGLIGRAVEGARGFAETWTAVRTSWRRLGEAADAGTLVACGVEGANLHLPADLPLVRDVSCGRCDYQSLCRQRGLK